MVGSYVARSVSGGGGILTLAGGGERRGGFYDSAGAAVCQLDEGADSAPLPLLPRTPRIRKGLAQADATAPAVPCRSREPRPADVDFANTGSMHELLYRFLANAAPCHHRDLSRGAALERGDAFDAIDGGGSAARREH